MVRIFHNPLDIIKNIFSPPKIETVRPGRDTRTAEQDAAAEKTAAEDAAREERRKAALRAGRRSTLLSPATPSASLGTQRKSLLGSS